MGFPGLLIMSVILQKKRLLLQLRGGSWPQSAALPESTATVVLALADENRLDVVGGLDVHDKGKNGRAAGASAVAGSLQSSMTESRRD